MEGRNLFLYWVGTEFKLIGILRNLIYLHSKNGKGYNVHLITDLNINEYVSEIPPYFKEMCPAHQADYVRVHVVCKYGGLWMDSDTLVLDSLDAVFDYIDTNDGLFIKQNNEILCNGIFGSKPNTPLMIKWKDDMTAILDEKQGQIGWCDIGNGMLDAMYNSEPDLYKDYVILNGLENVSPINWCDCVREYMQKPYENYTTLVRDFQPFLILVNSVYKCIEENPISTILTANLPFNYFINKSFENLKLIDYDFIEIGTSHFDTLIQEASDNTVGISVDAVKYYIDALPDKANCKKIHIGISNVRSIVDVYYIPEDIIDSHNLQPWFKGCNSINDYHPYHKRDNVTHLCKIDKVNVITPGELFYQNSVRNVKYLKIDTEGHDTIILKSLFSYIKYLPTSFYPNKILFESNDHTPPEDVDETLELYYTIGYKLESRGYDTVIVFE
jgi:hypothetical protein